MLILITGEVKKNNGDFYWPVCMNISYGEIYMSDDAAVVDKINMFFLR